MAVTHEIFRSWRQPRAVVRDLLMQGKREDRAIGYLMVGCFIIFVSQLPRLARTAHLSDGDVARLAGYEFLSWLIVWPLALYGLAALSRLAAMAMGGQGSWFGARLSLFWAVLALAPATVLYGLTSGLLSNDPGRFDAVDLTGLVWLGGFLWIWLSGLVETERAEVPA
ncbi:hypothetical protein AADZ90_011655 [Aestuariibius sp. 2305UL40-4]|uniref:hypothetical protein n=1 Tax=Aestuariibius violaceus TaxID=3234132 RepID=UPI00345E5C1F